MENDVFADIVNKHSNRLYLIALSYTKSHYDAEDIVQDVFIKLWKKDIRFNDETHMRKWLTIACVNKSKDYIKMSFLRKNSPLENVGELYTFDSPQDLDIFNAVMSLPKNERVAIHLFYFEDLSVKEISELVKANQSAIKTRLHRARKKLQKILGDDWINE